MSLIKRNRFGGTKAVGIRLVDSDAGGNDDGRVGAAAALAWTDDDAAATGTGTATTTLPSKSKPKAIALREVRRVSVGRVTPTAQDERLVTLHTDERVLGASFEQFKCWF